MEELLVRKVEVTHIPGTRDNQDRVDNPVVVEDCPQMADSPAFVADNSAIEAGNSTPIAGGENQDMTDMVDTLDEIAEPLREMTAMRQIHARGV
jgi:hypothetical protein